LFFSLELLDFISLLLPAFIAAAVAILIGVIFGLYPANKAAKLEPVAAINSD